MPVVDCAADNITGVPYDQWGLGAGATKVAAVATNDGDTSYVWGTATNQIQCFNVSWPSDVATVNSIVAKAYLTSDNGSYLWPGGVGVRNASGEDVSNVTIANGYALYTRTCSKPGGGSWLASDCANGVTYLEVRVYTSPGGGHARCTETHLTLDYVQGGACFLNIWSVVLPLLGAGLGLAHMRGIARECGRRYMGPGCRVWFRPEEYAAALESWRAWRRPAFAFLGA